MASPCSERDSADSIWRAIREEVTREAEREPMLAGFLHATILKHTRLEDALSFHLAGKLATPTLSSMLIRENCARKCPYGNITMRPLDEDERPSPEVTKRAIKCNLCRGHGYSNCVHECPRGAIVRVDPLRYFEELALVMEAEQRDAIEWSRKEAKNAGTLGTKQRIVPRSTWFIPASLAIGAAVIAGVIALSAIAKTPLRGGTPVGLLLGGLAGSSLLSAGSLGIRKRLRNVAIGGLEAWTQFHMMFGAIGFVAATAHAGFRVTGIFTTLLMLVFAAEIATGVLGQFLYATVPSKLTALERHGQSRLVEDLLDEQMALDQSTSELAATLSPDTWSQYQPRVMQSAGPIGARFASKYDPADQLKTIKSDFKADSEVSDFGTIIRLAESQSRKLDVAAQLTLHRRMKSWLVVHVAIASALVIMLVTHIITALTLL